VEQRRVCLTSTRRPSLGDRSTKIASTTKAFNFWTSLARALHLSRTEILTCLDGARKQWHKVTGATVLDTLKLCFITGQMDMYRTFLDCAWNISDNVTTKFDSIYTPLVPQLFQLLEEINLDVCVAPFIDFFRLYISHYLHYMLGDLNFAFCVSESRPDG
jgi:hypothetical protein